MTTPVVLMILDGWGDSPHHHHNAIATARTPNWDRARSLCPPCLIDCSGPHVGLPDGQMGNSEVGHMHLGAGRLVRQDLSRIDAAIEDGTFGENVALQLGLKQAQGNALHIMGLLSPGGVHSSESHIKQLVSLAMAQSIPKIYLHAFLDGRDTPPQSARPALEAMAQQLSAHPSAKIATIVGRYYAMDRDQHWDRTQRAHQLIVDGLADFNADDVHSGLAAAYARGETDEFVQPTVLGEPAPIHDGDVVIFMNFRSDRARQLSRALSDPTFNHFKPRRFPNTRFMTLTQYADDIDAHSLFPPQTPVNTLGEYLASLGRRQLRIAETEKYAHVTFFFNGGVEKPFPGEDRILIPSQRVATYDLAPEMQAQAITTALIEAIATKSYDLVVLNFANADMVGHSGDFKATCRAIEVIDDCLGKIHAALRAAGGELLITADHGNAEQMYDENSQQAHTAHTQNPVPLVYLGRPAQLATRGKLSDIAPTILNLLQLPIPKEMTGQNLIQIRDHFS